MIERSETNRYNNRDLSKFAPNLLLPRHRWYSFKEGFSENLVREAVDDSTKISKRVRMLDPFAGSGTTLVTAGRMGHEATGIEVNPFLAFAAQAKCDPGGWTMDSFQSVYRHLMTSSTREVASPLEGYSTFTEKPESKKWLFNRSVLRGFSALEVALQDASQYRNPLRLALFASLVDCCNAKRDGKCLRYRRDWEKLGFTSADLRKAFEKRSSEVANDITCHSFDAGGITIVQGDARQKVMELSPEHYDLVVTSPPYLNSFDYSDVYRPELFAGQFVHTNEELRRIRLETIRSHVQVAWTSSTETSSSMLPPLIEQLSGRTLWDRRLPDMIQSYFADMAKVLRELTRVVKRNGRAWIVVGTSAYAGVEIPVDLILADIATTTGWKLLGVYVLRMLRASGQHWARLQPVSRAPLRESLIMLQR